MRPKITIHPPPIIGLGQHSQMILSALTEKTVLFTAPALISLHVSMLRKFKAPPVSYWQSSMSDKNLVEILDAFNEQPEGVFVVSHHRVHGWYAPGDTVIFDSVQSMQGSSVLQAVFRGAQRQSPFNPPTNVHFIDCNMAKVDLSILLA